MPETLKSGGIAVIVGLHARLPDARAALPHGRLPIDRLITNRVSLDEVGDAFELIRSGARGRSVIMF